MKLKKKNRRKKKHAPCGTHPSLFRIRGRKLEFLRIQSDLQRTSSTEASKASHKCKAAVLLAVALLLLLLGALLVAYFFTSGTNTNNVVVCRTDDCAAFGRELSAAINVAIDPCHDFHSYVCGSWDDQSRQESTEGRMRVAALNAALKEIRDSPDTKAAHFYDSCHSAVADLKENLRLFAEFRKSLGLTWPERSVQGAKHPVEVMVNLALNWQMNFLFDMSVVTVQEYPTLLMTRGRIDTEWEQDIRNPRTPEEYQVYLRINYEVLGVNESQARIETAELIHIEEDIVRAKIEFLYDTPQQDWYSVNALDSQTPTVPAGLWLNALAKYDKQFNWTKDSTVIVEDVKILENIDKLLKKFTREELVIGLSWIFIQTHLWAVCGMPSLRFRASFSELKRKQADRCMTYVQSLLGLYAIPKLMTTRYGYAESRYEAFSFMHRMNEHIKHLVNATPWMDEESKRMSYSKLDKMKRFVMPNDSFFIKKEREALYSVFPNMKGKNFMTNLVGASQVYQRLRSHKRFHDVYSVRMFPHFGRELYLYLPNTMTLAIGDLNPPLFYHNATLAIRYGGLGTLAGRQMVKTLDATGVTVDAAGVRGTWLKPPAAAVHAEKSNCDVLTTTDTTRWRPLRMFPAVVGLEVAYESFIAAVTRDYQSLEDLRILNLEQFTDSQIFFLTFCYSVCSKRPERKGDDCNVPVKNSLRFAEAFHCPSNAPMNPPRKCSFFEQ
nr:neprilysin-1-like [Rhipicephalus microplus]